MTIQKTPMVTTKQAAAALGIDERTIEERLVTGQLKGEKHHILFKEKWFVYKSEVDALITKLQSRLFDDREVIEPPPKTNDPFAGPILHEDFDPLTNHTFIDAYREFSARNQNFSPPNFVQIDTTAKHETIDSFIDSLSDAVIGQATANAVADDLNALLDWGPPKSAEEEEDPVLRFRDGKNFAPTENPAEQMSPSAHMEFTDAENEIPSCEITPEFLEAAALMLQEPVVDENSEYHQTMRLVAQEFGGCLNQSFTLINDLRRELQEKDIQLHLLPDLQRRVEADKEAVRIKEAELAAAKKKISELETKVANLSKSPWKRFFEKLAGQT